VRLLIDTHILLWADRRPRLITPRLRAALRDEANDIVVSATTGWEIAIKRAIGKLRLDRPIVATVLALGLEILPVALQRSGGSGDGRVTLDDGARQSALGDPAKAK
jgi:PIN domain nuclease of toxin-antitoxin system